MAVKKKFILLPILLAAIVFAGVYLYQNGNSIILRTTERIASNALGVSVNIGSIQLSLADKSVTLNSLKIANPPGYHDPYIITANSISVGLNTASKQLIDLQNIEVKGVDVYAEVTPQGTNLMDLKKLATSKKQAESTGNETIRVIVQKIVIDASTIHPKIALLNRDIAPIKIPAVNASGVTSKGGSDAKDVIVKVLNQYLGTAQQAVTNSGVLSQIPNTGNVKKTLDNATGNLKKLF